MKILVIVCCALVLSACATTHYGNYTQVSEANHQIMVKDAIARIIPLYPPAKTTLKLAQRANDSLGVNLINAFRKSGYRVVEGVSRKEANFFYLVDRTPNSKMIRLSLFIEKNTLTRAYAMKQNRFMPLGFWARQESVDVG